MTLPFAAEGVPTATSSCGAAPKRGQEGAQVSAKEKPGTQRSTLGEFMRSFWGN